MGNIRETIGQTERTVVKVEKCGHSLSKEREPKLGGDLDVQGYDLENVNDIACKTINGEKLDLKLEGLFSSLKELMKGHALKDHEHADIKAELLKALSQKADKDHSHPEVPHTHNLKDLAGNLPLSKMERGSEVSAVLSRSLADADHSHPDLSVRLSKMEDSLKSLPAPEVFDPSAILKDIASLKTSIAKIKPVNHTAEVTITPLPAPKVTADAAYLIVSTLPADPEVTDSKGQKGTARVTSSGKKHIVRGIFPQTPTQPLTYSFSSPPTLCGIGVSTENLPS